MKAVRFLAPNVVETVELPEPIPRSGEALVRVRWAGICGSDLAIVAGKHPRARAPLTLGHEFAGEIVAVNGISALKVGARVTANPLLSCGHCRACRHGCGHVCRSLRLQGIDTDGFMAELACVSIDRLQALDADVSAEAGALVEPLAVGIHAVEMATVQPGDRAVVMGAGPIGLVVALALRQAGVGDVWMTDVMDERLAMAEALGFGALNAAQTEVGAFIRSRTSEEGADLVFEAAGSSAAARQMTELVRVRGTVVLVSVHKAPHETDLRAVNFKELTLVGSRVYTAAAFQQAARLAQVMGVERLVSRRVPVHEAAERFAALARGEGAGKILISME